MPEKHSRSKAEKTTQEVERSKSGLIATWIGAVATVIGLAFVGYQIYLSLQPKPVIDTLTVSKVELMLNGPTSIRETHTLSGDTTGIISVLWKIVLTNIGEKDLSVIKYEIIDKSDNLRLGEYYTGLDQGIFNCGDNYSPLSLPINISNGSSTSVCLQIGFVMDKDAYKLLNQIFLVPQLHLVKLRSFYVCNPQMFTEIKLT